MALFRWHHDPEPKKGDERIVARFLWLPHRIGLESRWLGRERILERAVEKTGWFYSIPYTYVEWEEKAWAETLLTSADPKNRAVTCK